MRSDKLAQILSHGGVFPGAKVLVFESVVGLVVGSIAYRMGGQGEILSVYFGQQPHFDLVDRLNLSPEQISTIRVIPASFHSSPLYSQYHQLKLQQLLTSFSIPNFSIPVMRWKHSVKKMSNPSALCMQPQAPRK